MKIYKVWQDVNSGYDTFDSAVVVAESEDAAREIHPSTFDSSHTWASKEHVQVKEIGEANKDMEHGVVVASFNAG